MATIFLDLDGTLIDVRRRHYQAYADTLLEVGRHPRPEPAYWAGRLNGASNVELIDAPDATVRQLLLSRWLRLVESPAYLRLDTPFPGARKTISTLAHSHDLVLVTLRKQRRALIDQLRELAMTKFFTAIYTWDGPREAYSKPDIIRLFAPAYPRTATVVGDTEADVEAARALGLRSICVANGLRDRRFLQRLDPDEIISTIAQLPEALGHAAPTLSIVT